MAYSLLAFLGKQRNDMRQNLVSFNYLRYTSLQRGKAIFQAPELTNMARIVYATRVLVSRKTPWSDIERQVLEHYALPGGRAYTCDETTGLANQMLKTIPPGEYRRYLPEGKAILFHASPPQIPPME